MKLIISHRIYKLQKVAHSFQTKKLQLEIMFVHSDFFEKNKSRTLFENGFTN